MRILLMGAPGAGKGTQSKLCSEKLHIPQISTGDIFRSNIKNRTSLGEKVRRYLESGHLVPDELTVELVRERLKQEDCDGGFIMDGFPRTLMQAQFLDRIMEEMSQKIDRVVNLSIMDEEIVKRLSGRRVCTNCGKNYHIEHQKSQRCGICDHCDTALSQRQDDKEDIVRKRLSVYHQQTKPLIQYYRQRHLLLEVDATKHVDEVLMKIIGTINR